MNTRDLVEVLLEDAGIPVISFQEKDGRRHPWDLIVVKINEKPRKIALEGTCLFICNKETCDHQGEKHHTDLSDPDSLEIIKGWIPWLEKR